MPDTPNTPSAITPHGPARALRFDRRFSEIGVPRLQRSSGTRDPHEFAVLDGLITALATSDDTAVIVRMFAAGRLSTTELQLAATAPGRALLRDKAETLERQIAASRTDAPAPAVRVRQPAPMGGPPTRVSAGSEDVLTHVLGDRPSPIELIERPLWTTAPDLIAGKDIEKASARRYLTSIEALRRKAAMLSISAEAREVLAGISELEFAALETFRRRGLTINDLMTLVCKPVPAQEQYLRTRKIKLSPASLRRVAMLSRDEWEALESVGPHGVSAALMAAFDRLSEAEIAELPEIAKLFGPDATFANLIRMTKKQWKLLSKVWATSNADWNHVRRALSAVLTQLFGDSAKDVRQYVISRIPLLPESGRIPQITPQTFWRIMDHVPEHARAFPLFLVISGVRVGEYEALEPSHLHHETCMISVPGTKTDGSNDSISIEPDLWHVAVNAVPSPYRYAWMRRIWRAACEAAGVSGVTLHDLRHCHGQWALDNGALETEVQAQLRHSSLAMTRRYTRTLAKEKSAAAAAEAVMAGRVERA